MHLRHQNEKLKSLAAPGREFLREKSGVTLFAQPPIPDRLTESLRIALLLDPFSVSLDGPLNLRVKWGDHAPQLAQEFLSMGHIVRGFGAPPGLIPHSDALDFESGESSVCWNKLQKFRPDVLIAYDALSPAAWRGARTARKLGSTLLLVESALPQGGRWHERLFSRIGELLWGRYVRRTAGAVVALDELSRRHAIQEGFDSEIIRVIHYGVDTRVFRPGLTSTLVSHHRVSGRILLYVGKVEVNRGLEVLITAFASTVGMRSDWKLVIAGDGSLMASLKALTIRLGVGDRVHWIGRPREEELPGLMGASTLLAVPAEENQVVGRQVGRALACGLPVILSDVPRFAGLVEDSVTGCLVPPGNQQAWTEAIGRVASSPVARQRWAKAGRALAEQRLAWPTVAEQFEAVLQEAMKSVEVKLRSEPKPG